MHELPLESIGTPWTHRQIGHTGRVIIYPARANAQPVSLIRADPSKLTHFRHHVSIVLSAGGLHIRGRPSDALPREGNDSDEAASRRQGDDSADTGAIETRPVDAHHLGKGELSG